MSEPCRSPTLRLPVKVRCQQEQAPPWHDLWEISMDETSLTELSAELLALPDPLPARLHQLRRLIESVVSRGLETHKADWEHGLHPATLAVTVPPTWKVNEHGVRVLDQRGS
jgi:hypothetical protein